MDVQKFVKTQKQMEAIPVLSGHKHTALYGGSRSGKTFIIVYALIVRASKVKSRHLIIRKTFSSVKRSIFLDTFPKVLAICFPKLEVKYNKTDFYVTFPNGSEIWFCGLDDSRVEKILGMEFSTIYFNEASELDYSPIQTVLSRLAEKNALKKRIWYDFNPPSKVHFSYWLFIKKVNPVESEPLKNPDDYGHLLMNPKDNIANIDDEYIAFLEAMPEKERQRFLEGKFADNNDGIAYYEFDYEKHVREVAPPSKRTTVLIGGDFNVQPMTAVVATMVNGNLEIYDEMFLENSDTPQMSHALRSKGYIGNFYPDSTGKNRKTSGKTDHQILRDDGFKIISVANPLQYDRVNNINRLLKEGRIVIDPRCKKLINDLNKVSWKDNKLDQKTDPMLTHISDALGYLTWNTMPFFSAPARRTHSTNR